ncbi:uncharacterized protein LY79DRAFT_44602 [Colletotrichum navitas]|uniref:Uncharacterized protein n=1 Tax=Colletotrichum navitas TaxID=681940 RepID=A0AAD8UZ28_9PEZI|nr:uncharacterized protein LY79DRAFT_44602 [Colletotrichum navitas]KAK1572669.1 hypothetical protein LY79DRAFT_44602 [Colletotrichum navitas]
MQGSNGVSAVEVQRYRKFNLRGLAGPFPCIDPTKSRSLYGPEKTARVTHGSLCYVPLSASERSTSGYYSLQRILLLLVSLGDERRETFLRLCISGMSCDVHANSPPFPRIHFLTGLSSRPVAGRENAPFMHLGPGGREFSPAALASLFARCADPSAASDLGGAKTLRPQERTAASSGCRG